MASVSDPVKAGLIKSLARPAGNITGVSVMNNDLSAKLTALLVEIIPGLSRLGVVLNSKNPGSTMQNPGVGPAIRALHLQSRTSDASTVPEFERAFARLGEEGVQGVIFSRRFVVHRACAYHCGDCAQNWAADCVSASGKCRSGWPLVAQGDGWTTSSAKRPCMSIAFLREPSRLTCRRNNQQFELVINSKTANALGLKISDRLIALADEVIE